METPNFIQGEERREWLSGLAIRLEEARKDGNSWYTLAETILESIEYLSAQAILKTRDILRTHPELMETRNGKD